MDPLGFIEERFAEGLWFGQARRRAGRDRQAGILPNIPANTPRQISRPNSWVQMHPYLEAHGIYDTNWGCNLISSWGSAHTRSAGGTLHRIKKPWLNSDLRERHDISLWTVQKTRRKNKKKTELFTFLLARQLPAWTVCLCSSFSSGDEAKAGSLALRSCVGSTVRVVLLEAF